MATSVCGTECLTSSYGLDTFGDEAVQVFLFLLYIATPDEAPPRGSQSGGGATRVARGATNEGLEGLSQDPGHHCLPPIRTVLRTRSD